MSWRTAFRARQFVRGSLWLIPVCGGALGALAGIVAADTGSIFDLPEGWTYSTGTAEAVLAAVVGASVGLTGFVVTVSVLIVQMATGTFSARYMRLFYRDGALKAVLAVLVGTLTFSYMLLRRVEQNEIPNFGITLAGVFLALGLLLFLVFLDRSIHRLRPVAVAELVGRAGRRAFDEPSKRQLRAMLPSTGRLRTRRASRRISWYGAAEPGPSRRSRGRASFDSPERTTCLVVVPKAAGDFVPEGSVLMEVYGGASLDEGHERQLRSMIALGVERTIEQDPAFAIRVMVDIVIRGLSPAVNDPTTAVQVLDHLGETLRLIGATRCRVVCLLRTAGCRTSSCGRVAGRTWSRSASRRSASTAPPRSR